MFIPLTDQDRKTATLLAIKAAREDLLSFILLMDPSFSVGPHHRLICDELMKIEGGATDRLIINIAPRSSKSTISSIYFAAWCLGRHPEWQWIGLSHSAEKLAAKFGREVRNIVSSVAYSAVFPHVKIRADNRAADDWGLSYKEMTAGHYLAAGTGTGIAGLGGHIIVIDDPTSEQEAFSNARREFINEWYPGGCRSRLMPDGRIVLIQTRWNELDLSGYVLQMAKETEGADQWRVITIPALNTPESALLLNGARHRLIEQGFLPPTYPELEPDNSFWPASDGTTSYFWGADALLRTKASLPAYQWDSIYMQTPTAPEGGIFKTEYWKDWEDKDPPKCSYVILSLDTAFSVRTSADFSAITTWGLFTKEGSPETSLILLGAEKGRWDYPTLRTKVTEKYKSVNPDIILIEKKASGQSLLQDLRLAGLPVRDYQPDRDKEARAHACVSLFHNGRIWAPLRKNYAKEVIDECRRFKPGSSAHDDYVDTVTQAILWMRSGGLVSHTKDIWNSLEDSDTIRYKPRRRFY